MTYALPLVRAARPRGSDVTSNLRFLRYVSRPTASARALELLASAGRALERGRFRRFATAPPRACAAALRLHAATQGVHQVHHVGRRRHRRRRRFLAGLLGGDQLLERALVAVLELRGVEFGLLGLEDVLRQIEHVLRD